MINIEGAQLAANATPSCPDAIRQKRAQHARRIDVNHVLLEDMLFSSPSAAAGFVNYASANGLTMWATDGNRTLKELEQGTV